MMRLTILLAVALCTSSCSIVREIRVFARGEQLFIDFPWSLWRLVGLQDRTYPCIDRIEVYDRKRVVWEMDAAQPSGACADARMPIEIGRPREGFIARGAGRLQPGRYGVSIQSYAHGRVDFVLKADRSVRNIGDWDEWMEGPCGTYGRPGC